MGQTARVHPLRCRRFYWPWKRVAFSLPLLQKRRRRFPYPLLHFPGSRWYSNFLDGSGAWAVHVSWWHRSLESGADIQGTFKLACKCQTRFLGNWLGLACDSILAERVLHRHLSLEPVLLVPGIRSVSSLDAVRRLVEHTLLLVNFGQRNAYQAGWLQ